MQILSISIPLQVVAFAFTLIASISSPVVDKLAVASKNGTNIGIFGYCTHSKCSSPVLHNNFSNLLSSKLLSDKTLDTLSPYLILCPIATGITFISLIFTIITVCVYKRRELSLLYWISSIVASVFAFLTSTAVCIIVILMFYPSVTWLAWCLVSSAALNLVSLILTLISMKLLPSPSEILSDDEAEKSQVDDVSFNHFGFDESNDAIFRNSINVPSFSSQSNIKNADESRTSSMYTSTEKNESLVIETLHTPNSSNQNLRVPDIANPYSIDSASHITNSKSNLLSTEIMSDYGDIENDSSYSANRLQEHENLSSNSLSSNFTSISQRPINPQYYAGGVSQQRQPLQSYQQQLGNNQRFTGYGHQHVQLNQFQQQMAGVPNVSRGGYMAKPKPYMMLSKNSNLQTVNSARGYNVRPQPQNNLNHQQYLNYGTPQYNNQYNNQYNAQYNNRYNNTNHSYPPNRSVNTNPGNNSGYAPMRYKGKPRFPNVPASAISDDGPYAGFR